LAESVIGSVAGRLDERPQGIALLAVGKLGGREMGFGSDLDLIVIFDQGICGRHTAEQVARDLAGGLSVDASLYTVDFRLRPEGKNAPLAVELGYLRSYLKERAEPWERMALTRCRIVWGDRPLGSRVIRTVRALAQGPIPRAYSYLLAMRNSMERQRVRGSEVDLKVSAGGIADVEFFAQAMALRRPGLMGRSTDAVLRACLKRGWVAKEAGAGLRSALDILRRSEMLTATSAWPSDELTRACLAAFQGFDREGDHRRSLRAAMRATRTVFRSALRSIDLKKRRP
jgi:glutamate-ammonia-ligase adenylyltransferase